MKSYMLKVFLQIFLISLFFAAIVSSVKINEFVVDPQTDWDDDNSTNSDDEFVEIYNDGLTSVDLTGWILVLNDSLQLQ